MPEISRFYGIVIRMRYREHPPPHFHAYYGKQKVSVEIETGNVRGEMSKRALRLTWDWMEIHEEELAENWQRAQDRKPLREIEPLP